jgi:integrase
MPGHDKLSATRIAKLKKPGRYGDGLNLWLQVSKWNGRISKSWVFQYTSPTETKVKNDRVVGRVRQLGLGPLHTVSLAEARKRAAIIRLQIIDGIDPIEASQADRATKRMAAAKLVTFQQCADQYIAAHQSSWRNLRHRGQWLTTLSTYAFPIIGNLSVAAVDTALVLKILEPIWGTKTETAVRLRGRIESILDWARVRAYRSGENPARWRGHLDKLLPAPTKIRQIEHHPALAYAELPAFMASLREHEGVAARALEFTILTAARTGEVIRARWDEIDLLAKVWTVPAARMKAGREHRVPLDSRAMAILEALPREAGNPFVFIGGRAGASLADQAMLELLRDMRPGALLTVHGFRSTFRDWAAESTSFSNHVIEMALAHAIGDKVEAAYRRGDLFDKRKRLMTDWGKHCSVGTGTGKVVPIRSVPS